MNAKLHRPRNWSTRQVLLLSNGLSLCMSFYLSHRLLPFYRPYLRPEVFTPGPFSAHAWLLLLILPLWYLLAEQEELNSPRSLRWGNVFARTMRVQALGLAVLSVLVFAFKLQAVSRLVIFGFCALAVPVSLLARWLALAAWKTHQRHLYNVLRILVIGSRERAREFIRAVRHAEDGPFEVAGCLEPEPICRQEVDGVPILGTTAILRSYLFAHAVDLVVFAMPPDRVPDARSLIEAGLELGLRVAILPDLYTFRLGYTPGQGEATLDSLCGWPVVSLSNVPRNPGYLIAKRAIDVLASTVLLVLLAPLFALLAILIKLTSPSGPIFYRWKVLGVNKKPFVSYKFRTMVPDAESLKPHFLGQNEMAGPVFKIRHDPRTTSLGRVLRKYSLDELPQLYSVLKGDMSLVGPRPAFQEEADRYEFWQRRKLSIKPGITCLWQVNGRNEIHSFDEWARLDLEYIRNASLWLDLKILLKTVPAVMRGRGAY